MQEHINAVRTFCKKAGQPVPDMLTIPDKHDILLRAKLIMEEALEMCEGLGVSVSPRSLVCEPIESTIDLDFSICANPDPVKIMDACADMLWVGVTGPAVLFGLSDKLEACIQEVDRSNLSKFIDGHRDPSTGKWIKGPAYSPANIEFIING